MKIIFLTLLFTLLLNAESFLVSSIPLPKTYVQKMDSSVCDEACLTNHLQEGRVFSFLANAPDHLEASELNDVRMIYVTLFNLGTIRDSGELKIAMMIPHRVIGRYAYSTTNAAFSYLLAKNRAFDLKTFQIEDETPASIKQVLDTMRQEGYYHVIAPLTKEGAMHAIRHNTDLHIYFPTVHKKELPEAPGSAYFGGIDYRAQLDALLQHAVTPLVIFYDSARLGQELNSYTQEQFHHLYETRLQFNGDKNQIEAESPMPSIPDMYSYAVGRNTSNLETQLKKNEKIQLGSFVLNTPIVKSGMVMSQLTLYDTNVTNILSTQINYDPIIFSMTQYHDRKSMVIANSIGHNNNILVETNNLLSNDIVYDSINYATTVGTDLFFHLITNSKREYDLSITENQIEYPIMLVQPSVSKFIAYDLPAPFVTEVQESTTDSPIP